jgi:hypothetical protein
MRVNRTKLLLSSLIAWIVTMSTTAVGAAPLPPCVRTPALAIRTIAGNHLRFSIPIQAAPGVAATYKPSTPKLLSQMHRYPAVIIRARAGKGVLNEKSPEDALYLDVYTTVDATPGESLLDVPLKLSGTLKGCAVVRSLTLRLEVSRPDLMDGNELEWIHERLERGGLFTYEHRDFLKREGTKGPRYTLIGLENVVARPELRDESVLRYIDGRYFVDAQGNIGRIGNLSRVRSGWAPLHYGITAFAQGGHLLAIDVDEDGVADFLAGSRFTLDGRTGRFWLETNNLGRALFECLTAGREFTPEMLEDIRDSLAGTGRGPCWSLLGSGSGGGIGGGIGLPGVDSMSPPDCTTTPGLGGVSTDPTDPEDPPEPPPTVPTPEEAARMALEAEQETEENVLEGFEAPSSESSESPLDAAAKAVERVLAPVQVEFENVNFRMRIEPSFETPMVYFEVSVRPRAPFRPEQPPIGPDGAPEPSFDDPRCGGLTTDAARGTLFTNAQFCGGSDMLECLRRQEDSVYDITGGNCARVEGPADGIVLDCGDNASLFPDCDTSDGWACASRCPADQPWCLNAAPGSGSTPFLSLTPLGALLETLCRADCPEPR